MNIDYNKIYKKEEVLEMKEWFETHQLPQSMQIDDCTFSPNVARTVETLMHQALRFYDNPNMYGCIYILERIRQHIQEAEGKE